MYLGYAKFNPFFLNGQQELCRTCIDIEENKHCTQQSAKGKKTQDKKLS